MGLLRRLAVLAYVVLLVACAPSTPTTRSTVPTFPAASTSPTAARPERVTVPDLTARRVDAARRAVRARGFRVVIQTRTTGLFVSVSQPGDVIGQHPSAYSERPTGSTVTLVVAKPPACGVYRNPWCYNFDGGSLIYNPPPNFCSYFPCIGSFWDGRGYVIQCVDGEFSKSGGIQGSCSYHGGNARALYR